VPISVTEAYDTILDADLGSICRSTTWLPPPPGLTGLVGHPAGFMVGFLGKTVYASVPYLPHAWPETNTYTFYEDVVGVAVYGQTILVLTTGKPYNITGTDPTNLTPERLESGFACVSRLSIADTGDQIIYASPYGLVGVSTAGVELLTKSQLNKAEFLNFLPSDPTTLKGYYHDRKYIAFNSSGGFIYDIAINELSKHSIQARCAFTDDATGQMYYAPVEVSGSSPGLRKWDSSSTCLTMAWKSGVKYTNGLESYVFGRVHPRGSAMTYSLYADGVEKNSATAIPTSGYFILPGGFMAERYEIRITSDTEINRVELTEDIGEIASVPIPQ
jgi:hypothetical protein